jgi:DNA-binding response OmpR family regulator
MDGREVLARIKADARWRATPVIMISGEQDMQGIIDCIEAGADDYLFKPFNPVLLQARIKAGIERKRWHDREEQYRSSSSATSASSAPPSGATCPTTSSRRSSSARGPGARR